MRSGQRIGNGFSYLLLSVIYWTLVPLFTPFARAFVKNAHNPEHTDSVKRLTT
jgi:hypothetical protein